LTGVVDVNADKRRSTVAINASQRGSTHRVNGLQQESTNQGWKMEARKPFDLNPSPFCLTPPLLANAASMARHTLLVDEFGNRE
jgi:hypothetical protein